MSTNPTADVHFEDGTPVPKKTEVKYLGCFLNDATDISLELSKRISAVRLTLKNGYIAVAR